MTHGTFPPGFLWGASTAGHQVEGGNVNADIWPLEWAENSVFHEPSGDACDHYHRYPEDMGLLAELGCNAYRFSLEWARIEPEPGYFSIAALDHYRRMLETCLRLDLTPVVTLNHFTLPRWMAAKGGWSSQDAAKRFGEFAHQAARRLGDLFSWVCTLNEPNLMAVLSATGVLAMGSKDDAQGITVGRPETVEHGISENAVSDAPDLESYRIGLVAGDIEIMAMAHRWAGEAVRDASRSAKVGWTLALIDLQAIDGAEEPCEAARKAGEGDWLTISANDDFVGVQTYSRDRIGPEGAVPPPDGAPLMQTGWEAYPEALEHTVRLAQRIAGVPVLVTENGMATDDDEARIVYTRRALEGLARCIGDGIDVRGYLHWTLLDNFEWLSGYTKTFGLVAVDRRTFIRTVKPSARWLGEVAKRNALGSTL